MALGAVCMACWRELDSLSRLMAFAVLVLLTRVLSSYEKFEIVHTGVGSSFSNFTYLWSQFDAEGRKDLLEVVSGEQLARIARALARQIRLNQVDELAAPLFEDARNLHASVHLLIYLLADV